jgi:hypothetical protein
MGSIAIHGMPTAVTEEHMRRRPPTNPSKVPAGEAKYPRCGAATLDIAAAAAYSRAPDGIPMRRAMPRLRGEPP